MTPDIEELLDRAAQLPPARRPAFLEEECEDPSARAEVTALLAYATEAESWFDQAIQGVASSFRNQGALSPGDAIGSYRILSAIGHGGMGSVYLAERADGEIQQRVAIKLLRGDGHRPAWRDHFLKERQLLASLQHASIVHVIDAGHTGDDRPFLVMEYVEGEPIDRYAAGIPVKERLKLFLRVCQGVSHAHGHLIIHRDLKPSNILVDRGGQPKLLDFGIAKLLNDSELAGAQEQLLTPDYASPEQMRGDAQSTSTDLYSLGAVLYKLLTGFAPREALRSSPDGQLPPVRRANPEVPGDLDFVVSKALRPSPEQRYASVDEFAGDVRAVLERRPVAARGNAVWYRARRHLRRHWLPAAAVLLVIASLSTGLYVADRERRIAERRFDDVRQLSDKLFDIDRQVAQLPGGSKTRQFVVNTALDYLKRVTADVRMDPGLALELGTAYMRVARVQGVNISPNLGQTEQAEQSAMKAQELIDSVLKAQPANRTALLRAAQIAHDRMILTADQHRDDEALGFAGIAVERVNQYLRTGPLNENSDRQDSQQVIIVLINAANRFMRADRFEQAIGTARRAIGIAEATRWPSQSGAARMIVALAYRGQGDLEQALREVRESVRRLEPSSGETANGRLASYGLALVREGQILGEDGAISWNRPEEAMECLRRALKIREELARRDPGDFQSQYSVFFAETLLAKILRHGEPAQALALYDDGLRRLSGLRANAATLRNEAATLAASIHPLLRLGRRDEARHRLDSAFECLKRLQQYPAERVESGSAAADTLQAQAEYVASGGETLRAAALYDDLIGLLLASQPKPETNLEDAVELSNVYRAAAAMARRAGLRDRAMEREASDLKLWRSWDDRLPGNAFVRLRIKEGGVTRPR